MHKFILALAFVLASVATPRADVTWSPLVYGWGSGWCPSCYLVMNTDIPNSGTGWTGYLAGWGFWLQDGALVTRADAYYTNGIVFQRAETYLINGLERPDVYAYFLGAGYPYAPTRSGWAIGFTTPIPSGTWTLSVVLWHGNVSTTQTGTVTIP